MVGPVTLHGLTIVRGGSSRACPVRPVNDATWRRWMCAYICEQRAALGGAPASVQEDNAEWPRLLRSTRRRAAVSSGA